ncbi:hypothetical protein CHINAEXTREME_15175 [Halobiforma lacisalsi AJ5]|uniref:Zinc-ribbon domain-containing protein n=1 Tax=Natronobacterium lacisalsi AJ5 TaxID=358396 RepID=M0LDV3_NATLA|nr:hypothetical protein [Halobiforma lacisalsi]APW99031.1 hypothetical protein CHINAEXTREME_15175 [Halobiforma lacisalsi AJ5]EMA31293.1 hypothetical protein C445_14594 [Halobiforma lacisalsi AJ5]
MKWRCTWCGKPHEENDPPCDNCGHNKFERAIVREGDPDDRQSTETVDTGTTYVWECPNCGREHVRNNPPCSRCGNPELEKTEQTYDDVERELDTPGWFEVARPYLPVFAVVGVVVLLFVTGIVPPEILPGIGAPEPPEASGNGSVAGGLDLEATEGEIHERLEADRQGSRSYDESLAAFAEYQNRGFVAMEYDDAQPEPVSPDEFGVECAVDLSGDRIALSGPDEYENEGELADTVAEQLLAASDVSTADGPAAEGVDVHAVEGTIYVTYVAC